MTDEKDRTQPGLDDERCPDCTWKDDRVVTACAACEEWCASAIALLGRNPNEVPS